MDSELEAGYLMELFSEPIYLMGYASPENASVQLVQPSDNTGLKQDSIKTEPVSLKQEVKSIPITPKLPSTPQKTTKKCILLFISDEDELSSKESEFLAKVMQASKLQTSEYECINFRGITITDVATRYAFDKLVLFGVKIPNLDINQYKCTQVKSTKIISADAVWMIEANNGLKKMLWEQLQLMFELIK